MQLQAVLLSTPLSTSARRRRGSHQSTGDRCSGAQDPGLLKGEERRLSLASRSKTELLEKSCLGKQDFGLPLMAHGGPASRVR